MRNTRTVALIGKVGHGKTFLLNKLTGERYPSNAGARSCTRALQFGYTSSNEILVVDTPGFYTSEDVARHIAAQKIALEGSALSGIYIVVKYGRADEIAETVENIVGFVGDDDVRVIITHTDTAQNEPMFDENETKKRLSSLLGLDFSKILAVGRDTDVVEIESFILNTLHIPREFAVSEEQISAASALCVCARRFNSQIDEAYAKIASASNKCTTLAKKSGHKYETDVAIGVIQKCTTDMVSAVKENIFRQAVDLPEDQQNVIYGKAGLALSVRLKSFVEATNILLSWDVTNPSDPRNLYKACPHCGAVFVKTEGCDGATVCGNVPSTKTKQRPDLEAQFERENAAWIVQFMSNGCRVDIEHVLRMLRGIQESTHSRDITHRKHSHSIIESGCGASIAWNTMLPIDPKRLKSLGSVELHQSGPLEQRARSAFESVLRASIFANLGILRTWTSQTD